jgi:hypothetical protein
MSEDQCFNSGFIKEVGIEATKTLIELALSKTPVTWNTKIGDKTTADSTPALKYQRKSQIKHR